MLGLILLGIQRLEFKHLKTPSEAKKCFEFLQGKGPITSLLRYSPKNSYVRPQTIPRKEQTSTKVRSIIHWLKLLVTLSLTFFHWLKPQFTLFIPLYLLPLSKTLDHPLPLLLFPLVKPQVIPSLSLSLHQLNRLPFSSLSFFSCWLKPQVALFLSLSFFHQPKPRSPFFSLSFFLWLKPSVSIFLPLLLLPLAKPSPHTNHLSLSLSNPNLALTLTTSPMLSLLKP